MTRPAGPIGVTAPGLRVDRRTLRGLHGVLVTSTQVVPTMREVRGLARRRGSWLHSRQPSRWSTTTPPAAPKRAMRRTHERLARPRIPMGEEDFSIDPGSRVWSLEERRPGPPHPTWWSTPRYQWLQSIHACSLGSCPGRRRCTSTACAHGAPRAHAGPGSGWRAGPMRRLRHRVRCQAPSGLQVPAPVVGTRAPPAAPSGRRDSPAAPAATRSVCHGGESGGDRLPGGGRWRVAHRRR